MIWKIVLVTLMACSDPTYTPTKWEFSNELECIDYLGKAKAQVQPEPGSYLVCRK